MDISQFNIPAEIQTKFPDLVPLILESPSLPDSEKQYWFNSLSTMLPEQVTSLREILNDEKKRIQNDNPAQILSESISEVDNQEKEKAIQAKMQNLR
ncbi:MAG TPA: hypothetical protein PLQ36_01805, partial [Candidatus Gracilibacteria bacterium]|nr:hypothetical protein [Candidatus Gracilibacteria bacterium]